MCVNLKLYTYQVVFYTAFSFSTEQEARNWPYLFYSLGLLSTKGGEFEY